MLTPTQLYLLGHPIEDNFKYKNKYTFLGNTYKFPHYRILTIGDIVSKKLRKEIDLPTYVMDFVGENGAVLCVANIVNRQVVCCVLRTLNGKEFSVYGSSKKTFYGLGMLSKNFKYGDPIILVEGIADRDVISSFYPNTLGCMTSHMSTMQFEILKVLTDKVILGYDNDEAGIKGSKKDSWRCKQEGIAWRKLHHFHDFKDAGDLAESLYTNDEMLFQQASLYYKNVINSAVKYLTT